ncbi:MAG: amidohydrolase [Streptomycetaceae bacterium]|nr:amidohydrolase [Streptomycetaceae bacterium]
MTGLPADQWIVSSDSHIIEPPDLWHRAAPDDTELPRVVREDDGDWWYVAGRRTMSFLGIQAGERFAHEPERLRTSAVFEDVRDSAYHPARYLAENETDGIWGSVIYPSQGLVLYAVPESDVLTRSVRIYNDWLADFCAHDPARLKGIAMLNTDDPAQAARELRRAHGRGLVGALIPVRTPVWNPYRSTAFEPLWQAAEELGVPLSLHVGTDRADPRTGEFFLDIKDVPPSVFVNKDQQVRAALGDLILSGVFERHPGLRVGTVEHELSWIPFFLAQMDYTYTDRPARGAWHRFADREALPSHFWHRNCFASFQEDELGVRVRDVIGTGALMFGSDYPHTESTVPRSREILGRVLDGVPAAEAARIANGNVAELYGFTPPARSAT